MCPIAYGIEFCHLSFNLIKDFETVLKVKAVNLKGTLQLNWLLLNCNLAVTLIPKIFILSSPGIPPY